MKNLLHVGAAKEFIEEASPSPFLPLPIAQYQTDAVQLGLKGQEPTADMLLRRSMTAECN